MAGEAKLQAPNTELPPETVNQELAPSVTRAADWVSLSQGQLIWRRFKRSRMALYGMVVLIILYTGMLFCEFLSPYLQNKRFTDNIFQPPTLPRWVDAEGQFHLRPFIYKYDRKVNRETLEMTYTADTSKMYPIYFFVQGEPYKFLGVISTNIHLFGINSKEVPIFIWGSDRQGRDLFGRCLYGSRVSLTIGLVGVFLTIIIGTTLGVSSGYYGGRIDDFVQRFSELLMSIPQIPLWMALAAIVPATWPPLWVYLGITIILSLKLGGASTPIAQQDAIATRGRLYPGDQSGGRRRLVGHQPTSDTQQCKPHHRGSHSDYSEHDPCRDCPQFLGSWHTSPHD